MESARDQLLFDLVNEKVVHSHEVPAYTKHVSAKGGVLADEMGLGKTMEMVGLILANPGNPLDVSMAGDTLEEKDDQRTSVKMSAILRDAEEPVAKKLKGDDDKKSEEESEGKEESEEESGKDEGEKKEEGREEESKGKEDEKEETKEETKQAKKDEKMPDHLLFKTQATVVLCPNHLVQQWQTEIQKHTSPPLTIVTLTTKNELAVTTYNDIVEADIVIVSVSLLKNPNYFFVGRGGKGSVSRGIEQNRIESWVPTQLKRIRESAQGGLMKKSPVLEHFIWHRVILDEGHEVLDDPFYTFTFSKYRAKYYWYMTGTPFPNEHVMEGVTKFLHFPPTEAYMSWSYVDLTVENLYWRNTKESIKDEFEIPDTVEDVVLLDFTDVERAFYNEAQTDEQRREMSCWLQLNAYVQNIAGTGNKTLTQLRADMIEYKKKLVKEALDNMTDYKRELANLKGRVNSEYYNNQRKRLTNMIEKSTQEIKKHTAELAIFENTLPYTGPDLSTTATISMGTEKEKEKEEKKEKEGEKEKEKAGKDGKKENGTKEETKGGGKEENEKEAKDGEEEDVEMLDVEELQALTISKLKAKLQELGIELPTKNPRKAELIALFPQKSSAKEKEEKKKGKGAAKDAKKKEEEQNKGGTKKKDEARKGGKKEEVKEESSGKRKRADEDDSSEPLPMLKRSESLIKKQDEKLALLYLVDQLGTKLGHFVTYLKKLWQENPKHRVIVFSQFNPLLERVGDVLAENDIESAFVQGNVLRRNKALKAFKSEDSTIRVILLSLENAASGTNLMEASHIILLDPVTGTRKEAQAVESQAIGRAHRQGQTNQVTIVRFLIRGTVEHNMYVKNYLEEVAEAENAEKAESAADNSDQSIPEEYPHIYLSTPTKVNSGRPKIERTSTIGTLLARHKSLRKDASLMDLIEDSNLI
eukprot:Phypoly_transcript_01181.p1 GENE.Phypoly_transcript_01181~~Phypoly_transcript_01181.p1  ORF type:complete len:926 (+),score=269.55 Phypoly_transcript_01181:822-3599(+)